MVNAGIGIQHPAEHAAHRLALLLIAQLDGNLFLNGNCGLNDVGHPGLLVQT
jgi:hypothetical protein